MNDLSKFDTLSRKSSSREELFSTLKDRLGLWLEGLSKAIQDVFAQRPDDKFQIKADLASDEKKLGRKRWHRKAA